MTLFTSILSPVNVDGESGIQVKDVSCALTVAQRELEAPQSSCATGKGSNQVLVEASYEQQHKRFTPYGNLGSRDFDPSCKANQLYPHPHEDFAQSTDFQGENQPAFPEAHGEGTFLPHCYTFTYLNTFRLSDRIHRVV